MSLELEGLEGHKFVSLVHQPGTQGCVPGSSTRDTKLCVSLVHNVTFQGTQTRDTNLCPWFVSLEPGTQTYKLNTTINCHNYLPGYLNKLVMYYL